MTTQTANGALWRVVLIWLAGLGAAAQYGKISVVYDRLPALFPDAGAQLGFAVSLVGFVGIVFGIAAGVIVSAVGFRRALVGGMLVGAALSLYQASVPSYPIFLASRVLEGLSHLAIVVAAPTLIAEISPPRLRNFSLTLWGTFFGVAFTALVLLGLPVADQFGVPGLLTAHAAYMAVVGLIVWRVLPPTLSADQVTIPGLTEIVDRHKRIYTSPYISAPAVGWLFYTFGFLSLLTLIPPFIDPAVRTGVLAAMPLLSIVASLGIGVPLLRVMSAVQVTQLGFALSGVLCLLLLFDPGSPVLCLAVAASMGLVQGAGFAAVPQLNDATTDRALANGGLAQAGNLGNTIGTPILAAIVVATGFSGMMWTLAAVFLAGAGAHAVLAVRRSQGPARS